MYEVQIRYPKGNPSARLRSVHRTAIPLQYLPMVRNNLGDARPRGAAHNRGLARLERPAAHTQDRPDESVESYAPISEQKTKRVRLVGAGDT